ncbi:MAG: PLP-dependent aminotransferase family protein, partial [Halomonas sp.]|nr:PLP-dependent aminotransferase family protein [Halomonas sp.]
LFSASGKFRQCLRLNYAFTLTPAIEEAVRTVGNIATEMVEEARHHATASSI